MFFFPLNLSRPELKQTCDASCDVRAAWHLAVSDDLGWERVLQKEHPAASPDQHQMVNIIRHLAAKESQIWPSEVSGEQKWSQEESESRECIHGGARSVWLWANANVAPYHFEPNKFGKIACVSSLLFQVNALQLVHILYSTEQSTDNQFVLLSHRHQVRSLFFHSSA